MTAPVRLNSGVGRRSGTLCFNHGNFNCRFDGGSGWINDLKVKFTAAALTRERQSARQKEGGEPLHESRDSDPPMHTVLLRCAYMIGGGHP
jgi:hypothetical protein